MDSLDDIREASRPGYAPSFSITDALLEAQWCSTDDLQTAFETLEEWGPPSAIAFFQLPYPIRLPEHWIDPMRRGKAECRIFFRTVGIAPNSIAISKDKSLTIGTRRGYGDHETFVNAWIPGDRTGQLVRTQVLIFFRLWGWRAEMFPFYQEALASRQSVHEPLPFRGGSLTHDGRPVTVSTFEPMLAHRLREESLQVMESVLPLYAVTCLDPRAVPPDYLHNFFIMVPDCRLIVIGPGRSSLASAVKPFVRGNYGPNLSAFIARVRAPRAISVYEHYLLQGVQQVDEGEPGLAIVYTVMILDWFANEMIRAHLTPMLKKGLGGHPALLQFVNQWVWPEDKGTKRSRRYVRTPEKLFEYLPVIGIKLRSPLMKSVQAVIDRRNDIIHTNQTQSVDKEEALQAIRIGMKFINAVMGELQRLYGSKSKDAP